MQEGCQIGIGKQVRGGLVRVNSGFQQEGRNKGNNNVCKKKDSEVKHSSQRRTMPMYEHQPDSLETLHIVLFTLAAH